MSFRPEQPLSPLNHSPGKTRSLTMEQIETTPVGPNRSDTTPKIQLCFELRDKETKKRINRVSERILEVTVWKTSNLHKLQLDSSKTGTTKCFVRVGLEPPCYETKIFTTDVKVSYGDNENEELFMERFTWKLEKGESLIEKAVVIEVCSGHVLRNATILSVIKFPGAELEKKEPIFKWFTLQKTDRVIKETTTPKSNHKLTKTK